MAVIFLFVTVYYGLASPLSTRLDGFVYLVFPNSYFSYPYTIAYLVDACSVLVTTCCSVS